MRMLCRIGLVVGREVPAGLVVLPVGVLVTASPLEGVAMLRTVVPALYYARRWALEGGWVDVGWEGRSW